MKHTAESIIRNVITLDDGEHDPDVLAVEILKALGRHHFEITWKPRYGGLAACGCWTYAVAAGEGVGDKLPPCPKHGATTLAKANVDEPFPSADRWLHPSFGETT